MALEISRVTLAFDPEGATDEDLRRLVRDATPLLGGPFGHAYAAKLIETVIAEFERRAAHWTLALPLNIRDVERRDTSIDGWPAPVCL
jgi:hypothetical protein